MSSLEDFSIKAKNFKCFGEEEQGFECIKPINLIIGRNNSGKSSLLDLIEYTVSNNPNSVPETLWHNRTSPEFIAGHPLTEEELKSIFRQETSHTSLPGGNDWNFGKQFIGVGFRWNILRSPGENYVRIDNLGDGRRPFDTIPNGTNWLNAIADRKPNPLAEKVFIRISAERDISPENDKNSLEVSGNGDGATNIIQNFINKSHLSSKLVEKVLLSDLNEIFGPDAQFVDIICQQIEGDYWEIYLEEDKKGPIALSQSGSGLKTIILILIYIHLVPVVLDKELSQFRFGLEELENNLHPALLRRLLLFLQSKAHDHDCVIFSTTHSNVQIDLFSKNENSQIIHVTHNEISASANTVQTYIANRGVLDDLDVRASDLLQSNGIVWVEGPSDRIYLNRWINLWSEGQLREGSHYQCIFYGGRLLSHLSSEEPDYVDGGVSILNVNINSIMIIDSDKRNQQTQLNETKIRIIHEIEKLGGMPWVTRGREIENYIPYLAVRELLGVDGSSENVYQYDNFFDYLDGFEMGQGEKYRKRKSLFAERISELITYENSSNILDLSERMTEICQRIREWNSI